MYWACFLAGVLSMAFWQYFVKGRLVNFFYAVCMVLDALGDVDCGMLIRPFRKRRIAIGEDDSRGKIAFDESESFYHS